MRTVSVIATARMVTLAPTAKLEAVGSDGMIFMRPALDDGCTHPAVVVALLKAGEKSERHR